MLSAPEHTRLVRRKTGHLALTFHPPTHGGGRKVDATSATRSRSPTILLPEASALSQTGSEHQPVISHPDNTAGPSMSLDPGVCLPLFYAAMQEASASLANDPSASHDCPLVRVSVEVVNRANPVLWQGSLPGTVTMQRVQQVWSDLAAHFLLTPCLLYTSPSPRDLNPNLVCRGVG